MTTIRMSLSRYLLISLMAFVPNPTMARQEMLMEVYNAELRIYEDAIKFHIYLYRTYK